MSTIESIQFSRAREIEDEGLVFLGVGEDLQQWVDGIPPLLREEGILQGGVEFKKSYRLETSGGRIDLLMVLPDRGFDLGKLSLWRISWGDCSWLSDYIPNYASHFGYPPEPCRQPGEIDNGEFRVLDV